MRGQASFFFYFKMVISVLGVRTGERSKEYTRDRGEQEGENVRFKENTTGESRLIYVICKKGKNVKKIGR